MSRNGNDQKMGAPVMDIPNELAEKDRGLQFDNRIIGPVRYRAVYEF